MDLLLICRSIIKKFVVAETQAKPEGSQDEIKDPLPGKLQKSVVSLLVCLLVCLFVQVEVQAAVVCSHELLKREYSKQRSYQCPVTSLCSTHLPFHTSLLLVRQRFKRSSFLRYQINPRPVQPQDETYCFRLMKNVRSPPAWCLLLTVFSCPYSPSLPSPPLLV